MQKSQPTYDYERQFYDTNKIVAGVDEVGRGCIAGPVVAAAAIIPDIIFDQMGINDSKKLSEKKRIELSVFIKENADSFSIAYKDNFIVDKVNILQASLDAMKTAVNDLKILPDHLLIDGHIYRDHSIPFTTIKKGDAISLSIAAASIIAKVERDRFMIEEAAVLYPEYGFESHKGYGTKKHYEAIDKYGICPIHRISFLKKYFDRQISLF